MSETDVYRKLPPEKILKLLHDEANMSMRLYYKAIKSGKIDMTDRVIVLSPDYERLKRVYHEIYGDSLNLKEEIDDKEICNMCDASRVCGNCAYFLRDHKDYQKGVCGHEQKSGKATTDGTERCDRYEYVGIRR